MMMSPQAWREQIKPHLARIFAVGKAHGLPVAYHCCGALRPIIPDLIEIGPGRAQSGAVQLPRHGPAGAEAGVRRGTSPSWAGWTRRSCSRTARPTRCAAPPRRLIDGMTADGGGYILAASHTIPPETPDENIFAMYEEAGISREEIFDRAAGIRARRSNGLHELHGYFDLPQSIQR